MKIPFKFSLYFLISIFFLLLLKTAWVADDAFLTMRSVDNFVNGYGLRWNILERVQIYTHPLWMFLLSGVYYFFRNPLIAIYLVSLTISTFTIYLFGSKFTPDYARIILGFTILFSSKSFFDYSTSGLENPLTHLLMLLYLMLFFSQEEFSMKKLFSLFFIASLVAVNRMDTFLILIPSLLYVLYKERSIQTFIYAILGFTPFILWELFSLLYYGFPFPNTAYAKLATGIEQTLLTQQGFRYFIDSLWRDPLTLFVIFSAILFAFFSKKNKDKWIALGLSLYLVYIVKIGGDFMSGRFFSPVLLVAVVIITRVDFLYRSTEKRALLSFLTVLIFLRLYAISPYSLKGSSYGIGDAQRAHIPTTGLVNLDLETLRPDYLWVSQGLAHKEKGRKLSIGATSGFFAFYAGSGLHVVDTHGLGDPLLARLPAMDQEEVHIGHFFRAVPAGYWRFNRSFGAEIEDENLHKYYEKLSVLIHQEPLISTERILMIWRMNTGYYDYLLDAYVEKISSPQEE